MKSPLNVWKLLEGLNPEQQSAVVHTAGPLLVLAGAGTGKTRVIATRIANLLAQGVAPSSIVAVSFTRKAGEEMKTRVSELVGDAADKMRISTFHALGLSILREQHDRVGLEGDFGICDAQLRHAICEEVLDKIEPRERDEADLRDLEVSEFVRSIGSAKTSGAAVDALCASENLQRRFLGQSLAAYDVKLREHQLIDLDDMVRLPVQILENNASVRRWYQRRYRHVLIDEYQDTNLLQHRLMRCLVGPEQDICVVGDDDQSIYGFRGARRELILSFEQDFPEATVVKLTQNYRCSREIISVANEVIRNSARRLDKQLVAANGCSCPVRFVETPSKATERQFIAQDIQAMGNRKPGEVAILCRVRKGVGAMRNELKQHGVCPDTVAVMTLHASKGLEFPKVYLPGLEESTLPHWNAIQGGSDSIEEERRLFYVGVTRARKELTLSLSRQHGQHVCERSRFAESLVAKKLVSHSVVAAA